MNMLRESWVQIAVAAFLAAMFFNGYRKGFLKMSVSLLSLVLSIMAARAMLPYAQEYVAENTNLREWVTERVQGVIGREGTVGKFAEDSIEKAEEEITESLTATLPEDIKNGLPIMQGGALPGNIGVMKSDSAEGSKNKNTGPDKTDVLYQMLGIDRMAEHIADKIYTSIVAVILFLAIQIIVRILIIFLFKALDGILEAAGFGIANRIAGGGLGLLKALFHIWTIIIIIGILPESELTKEIAAQFNNTPWLHWLKETNLITRLLTNILS